MHPGEEVQSQNPENEKHAGAQLQSCEFYDFLQDASVFNLSMKGSTPDRTFWQRDVPDFVGWLGSGRLNWGQCIANHRQERTCCTKKRGSSSNHKHL